MHRELAADGGSHVLPPAAQVCARGAVPKADECRATDRDCRGESFEEGVGTERGQPLELRLRRPHVGELLAAAAVRNLELGLAAVDTRRLRGRRGGVGGGLG